MVARAHLRFVLRNTAGAVQTGKSVRLRELDGTTQFAGEIWDARTGGGQLIQPLTTNATTGAIDIWFNEADVRPLKIEDVTTGNQVYAEPQFDPRDVILQGGSVAANLNGYDGTGWAQTVKALQNDSGVAANIARFLDSNDAAILRLWRSTGGNLAASINLLNDTIPTDNTFEVRKAWGSTGDLVELESQTTAASIIVSTLNVLAKQTVAGVSNSIGVRSTVERSGSATADGVAIGFEAKLKATVASSTSPRFFAGFLATADAITSGVRTGGAFVADGSRGWDYGFIYFDTDNTTHLALIDSAGQFRSATGSSAGYSFVGDPDTLLFRSAANVIDLRAGGTSYLQASHTVTSLLARTFKPQADVTYTLGDADERWSALFVGAGLVGAPAIVVGNATCGLYSSGTDNLLVTTVGVARTQWDQLGNMVHGGAVATNAANGFLYIPTCAGTPTGTPTTYGGRLPLVIDSSGNVMYFYSGGAWRALN